MRMHALVVLSLPFLLSADAPQNKDKAFQQDLAALQGTWKPTSMEMDGKILPQERIGKIRLTIKGQKFTFDTGQDSHGGLYKIDPSKNPSQLNIEITRGDEVGKVYLVIYEFKDGKMIQCMQVSNEKRPTQFTGQAGSRNLYEVWERVK